MLHLNESEFEPARRLRHTACIKTKVLLPNAVDAVLTWRELNVF